MAELGVCWERDEVAGAMHHTQYLAPIAYHNGANLARIDSTWADSGIPGRPHLVGASDLMVSVADDGLRRFHPTRDPAVYLEIGSPFVKVGGVWTQPGFSGATRVGNLITWQRPQARLGILHAGHYCKLGMELLGGYVPEDNLVAFPVGMTGLTRSGGAILANGVPVCHLSPPNVYDAADTDLTVRHLGVPYTFTTLNGQPYVVMTLPNLVGMKRPVLDPTLSTQPDAAAGVDTLIGDGPIANNDYGIYASLVAGSDGAKDRGLIKFDLSSIPSTALIQSANVKLVCTAENSSTDYTVNIHRSLVAWFEGTKNGAGCSDYADCSCWNYKNYNAWVAWGAAGGLAGTDYASLAGYSVSITGTGSFVWDVTSNVAYFVAGTYTNYGWWLINASQATAGSGKAFGSSDNATAANRPQIDVVYSAKSWPFMHQMVGGQLNGHMTGGLL